MQNSQKNSLPQSPITPKPPELDAPTRSPKPEPATDAIAAAKAAIALALKTTRAAKLPRRGCGCFSDED